VPATFGALALAIVVYAVAEPALPSDPMGAVGGIQGAPLGPADVQAADVQAAGSGPPGIQPAAPEVAADAAPSEPSAPGAPSAVVDDGGAAMDKRAIAEIGPRPVPLAWLSGYQSPLPNGRITLPFGPSKWGSRVVDGEPFHDGLDLATFCGDRIVAAHDGVVLAAGRRYDRHMGWVGDLQPYLDRLEARSLWSTLPIVVVIDDGNGYRSLYAHLSRVEVEKGDVVRAGDLLGYEGRTGRASGCHLHYGLFSPEETAVFGIDPGVVERMLLPPWQIARVDPQLVLPEQTRARPTATPSPATDFAKTPIE
jgi:murein DD-endopeptidase MepM/ murein hydrolase activator NlpD